MPMATRAFGSSDVGRKRQGNEDAFLVDESRGLYVVADGMGGHNAGEVASARAIEVVNTWLREHGAVLKQLADAPSPAHALAAQALMEQAIQKACSDIFRMAQANADQRGMGTTLVGLAVAGSRGVIGHVGDSRLYLLRQGQAFQLSEDHTLIAAQIKAGTLTPDEAARSPYRNVITRAVGIQESVQVDTLVVDLLPGDLFLLCSDGLHGYLTDEEVPALLASVPWEQLPRKLIDVANSRGGRDNITAIVVGVGGEPGAELVAEASAKMEAVRKIPLFQQLTYKELTAVLSVASTRSYAPGREIIVEGETGEDLFVVIRGRVVIEKSNVEIAELSAGSHFGEMGLIDNAPRSATVRAVEATRVMVIGRTELLGLMRREPVLAVKLLWSFVQVLSDRLRNANSELSETRSELASPGDESEAKE